jgi:hypothetical protein
MERTAKKKQRTSPPAAKKAKVNPPAITDDDVRRRAQEIYLERGSKPGDELGDWLQAERELRGKLPKVASLKKP